MLDGKRQPRPHTERTVPEALEPTPQLDLFEEKTMPDTPNALERRFDFATAHTDATNALAGTQQMQSQFLIAIDSTERAEWANKIAKQVRTYKQQLEAQRDSGIRPLLEVVETIRGWFRDPIAGCEQVYRHLTEGVAAFLVAERTRQTNAVREATSQTEIAAVVAALAPKPAGTSERTYWHAEVVDASKLPPEYLLPDITRLNKEARELKERFAVPGAKAVPEVRVVPL